MKSIDLFLAYGLGNHGPERLSNILKLTLVFEWSWGHQACLTQALTPLKALLLISSAQLPPMTTEA
jgi:hypothetical protein